MAVMINASNNVPVYLNTDLDGSGGANYWSNAEIIYLNANSAYMFNNRPNLAHTDLVNSDWRYVTDCSYMFGNCSNFNQPVTLGDNITRCGGMFYGCNNFNQPVNIGDKVTACFDMFAFCGNYNSPVTIGPNVKHGMQMFLRCTNYNSAVTFADGITDANFANMFMDCPNFNQPVSLPQNSNCYQMFKNCVNLSSPVTGVENATDCREMFMNCKLFDSPVQLPSVNSYYGMFSSCSNFDQVLIIPNGAEDCRSMFAECCNLSVLPVIPSGVTKCNTMFHGVGYNGGAPIEGVSLSAVIPNTVTQCGYMFGRSNARYINFGTLYIEDGIADNACQHMFDGISSGSNAWFTHNGLISLPSMRAVTGNSYQGTYTPGIYCSINVGNDIPYDEQSRALLRGISYLGIVGRFYPDYSDGGVVEIRDIGVKIRGMRGYYGDNLPCYEISTI